MNAAEPSTLDYRPYGWRARLGLIVPTTNTVNEAEWARMAPVGVTVHVTRMRLHMSGDSRLVGELDSALDALASARPDVIAYGCTAGSLTNDLDEIPRLMRARTGIPAVATGPAIVRALQTLGVRTIALATPYHEALTVHERDFLAWHGIETAAMHFLGYGANGPQEFMRIAQVPPEAVFRFGCASDHPRAEALVLSCTDLPTCEIVPALEEALGKPVVTSNHATLWAALGQARADVQIARHGRVLATPAPTGGQRS